MPTKPAGEPIWKDKEWEIWKGKDKGYPIFTVKAKGKNRKLYSILTSPYAIRIAFNKNSN